MVLTRAKIKALEAKVKKKQAKSDKSNLQLAVPEDWASFARMVKIRSGGDVKPFDPYPYQIELVDLMLERSVCVVKSRQLGISETITCFMLWRACQNPGYLGLVFSKTQQDSSLLARRMKRMISSLGLKTATENLSDIEILGCGRILFRNSNPDSARGIESVVDVFLDELAFLETAKEVYDALAPAMQMVGERARVFAVSTPNGKTGFYWDLLSSNNDRDIENVCKEISNDASEPFQHWIDAGGWGKVLIHWKAHPIYGSNPKFLEDIELKQKLPWATIEQEYNLNFQESESNYFTVDIIQKGAKGVLEEPVENGFYYFGVDAAGMGEDYGVCVVLRKVPPNAYTLVAYHRKRRETNESHIYHISQLIKKYRPIQIGVETTGGYGEGWFQELSRIHFHLPIQRIATTHDSKIAMLSKLKLYLETERFFFPENNPLKDELLSFRYVDNKLQAAAGKHDDMVLAVSFALKVV